MSGDKHQMLVVVDYPGLLAYSFMLVCPIYDNAS